MQNCADTNKSHLCHDIKQMMPTLSTHFAHFTIFCNYENQWWEICARKYLIGKILVHPNLIKQKYEISIKFKNRQKTCMPLILEYQKWNFDWSTFPTFPIVISGFPLKSLAMTSSPISWLRVVNFSQAVRFLLRRDKCRNRCTVCAISICVV